MGRWLDVGKQGPTTQTSWARRLASITAGGVQRQPAHDPDWESLWRRGGEETSVFIAVPQACGVGHRGSIPGCDACRHGACWTASSQGAIQVRLKKLRPNVPRVTDSAVALRFIYDESWHGGSGTEPRRINDSRH